MKHFFIQIIKFRIQPLVKTSKSAICVVAHERQSSKALDWLRAQSAAESLDFSIESTFLRVRLYVCVMQFSRCFIQIFYNS